MNALQLSAPEIIAIQEAKVRLEGEVKMLRDAVQKSFEALPDLIVTTESEYEQQAKLYEGYPNMAYRYDYLKDEANLGEVAYNLCKVALSMTEAK
jgi:hypothetical protein